MRRTLWLSVVLVAAVSWANPPQTFSQGTLIIPMQANFQNECAMASAYGLVWKLLFENRVGGTFSGQPVTIYWAINGSKTSTNRCVPTNKHDGAQDKTGAGILAGKSGWDSGANNDGCDFSIVNSGRMPVVPVDYSLATFPATGIYPNNSLPQFDTSGSGQPSYDNNAPNNTGKGRRPGALDDSGTCVLGGGDAAPCGASRFTKVQYSGGAFIIDSSDAKRVMDAINGGLFHLGQHKSTNNSQCGGLTNNGATVGSFNGNTGAGGQVLIHQATTSFDAPIYKRITNTPPRIALVDFGGGTLSVLGNYLTRAQLQGDNNGEIGGQKVCGTPGSVGGATNCGTGTTGLIYDRLRGLDDLLSVSGNKGLINTKVSGKSRYKVIWAPHWELDQSDKNGSSATNAERGNALDNLDYFGDQKGNGILAECASIEGYEGSSAVTQYSSTGLSKFMFNGPIRRNGMTQTKNGRNCTDPWYSGSGMCTVYGAPSDAFSQVGDYTYTVGSGHVDAYTNETDGVNARKANVRRLASSWSNYPSGSDNTGNTGWDYATLRQKDDDPEKATVIYVAGHNLSNDPAGTRIVLNTLLNLGADPIPSDRNYSGAVGFVDATNSNTPTLISSIYQVVTGTLLPGATTYAKATGKNFMWPYTGGNLRIRNAATLVAGQNELTDSVMANAEGEMPLPNNRNLFTYFGGQTTVNPSLSGGRLVRNNVAQMGWVPERLEYDRINTNYSSIPNPGCVDVQKWGDVKDKVDGNNTPAMEPGADGYCDLQQAMQWSKASQDVDLTTGKHKLKASEVAKITAEAIEVQQFIQRVRGYCFATRSGLSLPIITTDEIMKPTDTECTDMGGFGDNRAHIGGAVRSSAAIVPPSTKFTDSGAPRPTVAYVGTWDGQLHAIYVGGGAGYTGPSVQRPHLSADAVCTATGTTPCTGGAVNTFKNNWGAGAFVPPNRGTELWSFMPASQLFWLRTNSAMVDSSPVVQDVFIDPYGTGKRSWHTVLVVSVGGTGREIFAFDVTNPLKPALLWDVVGSVYQVGSDPDYTGVTRSDFDLKGDGVSLEWDNSKADYKLDLTATDPGRKLGYPYDYTDLGGSRALAIGQMREGLIPTYAVYVASNSSNRGTGGNDAQGRNMSKSLNVFAIDIETGQKIWQWRHPYVVAGANSRNADNTVPPPVSVLNSPDGAGVVYAGDMEGRIWELDASTGRNLNATRDVSCVDADCNFALFDTRGTALAPEPITSNLAIAKVPSTTTASTPLFPYGNELVMVVGTGGTKWVPATVSGNLHTILLNKAPLLSQAGADRRKPVLMGVGKKLDNVPGGFHATQVWDLTSARASVSSQGPVGDLGGVGQNPVGMPFAFSGGDRVYGFITISGNTAYVPLVTGQGADPLDVVKDQTGKSLSMPLGNLPPTTAAAVMSGYSYANYGGLAVFEVPSGASSEVWVAGDMVSKTAMEKNAVGSQKANDGRRNTALSTNPATPYRLYNVVRRFFSQQ
ncbi:MAG: PilC/PilY family type IV pilus protein [Archangium sp.]